MPDLDDGQSAEVQGSGNNRYTLKNVGGVFSCSCPAWRNQSRGIEQRTCKHLRAYRGEEAERARLGDAALQPARRATGGGAGKADGPPVLLAERWDGVTDPTGWWMSEKLDGVRAYWDGERFVSRLGNTYMAPDWFVAGLPAAKLDGELWIDRGKFQATVSVVRRQDRSEHWKQVSYLVFDAPDHGGPFEDRLAEVERLLAGHPHARAHAHQRCEGLEHLRAELARVEALRGEGLMLRKPGSKYVAGRSATLLKVKTFHDAEARVLAHLPGAGRHKGRLGALQVELPDGTRFSVGTGFSDAEREAPPPVGSIITFRYQELSDGNVPRFPSYVGVRHDVAWQGAERPVRTERPKKAARPAPAPSATVSVPSPRRRLELGEGDSGKFWEVEQQGCELYVRFGRLGRQGQTRLKTFPDEAAAAAEAAKLAGEKLRKGYVEQ